MQTCALRRRLTTNGGVKFAFPASTIFRTQLIVTLAVTCQIIQPRVHIWQYVIIDMRYTY